MPTRTVATTDRHLVLIDRAVKALAEAKSIDDVKEVCDQAEAFRIYARKRGLGDRLIVEASVIKLRADADIPFPAQSLSAVPLSQTAAAVPAEAHQSMPARALGFPFLPPWTTAMTTATRKRGRPPKAESQLPPSDRTDAAEPDDGYRSADGNGKATQTYIDPDMAPPAIKEIDDAAEEYRRVRDRRMELTKEENRWNEKVVELMRAHGLTEYTFDGSEVTIKNKTKARVRRIAEDDEGEE